MIEGVVELVGKDGVVTGAVAIFDEVVISRHGMQRHAKSVEGCADDGVLGGFAAVGEVAGDQAEGRLWSARSHFRDDGLEERGARVAERMQIVDRDEGEALPSIGGMS